MILTSLLPFKIMNYTRVHEAILKERRQATQVGTLKMNLPKALEKEAGVTLNWLKQNQVMQKNFMQSLLERIKQTQVEKT